MMASLNIMTYEIVYDDSENCYKIKQIRVVELFPVGSSFNLLFVGGAYLCRIDSSGCCFSVAFLVFDILYTYNHEYTTDTFSIK